MSRSDGPTLRFDAFHLPPGVDLLYRGADVMPLEPRAVRVLRYLVEHHDRVLTKEEILEEIWADVFTTDGVLKKAVSQIRRVIGDDAERSKFIATYHSRGYRFIAPVNRAHTPPPATTVAPIPPAPSNELIPNYDRLAARDAEMLTLRAELKSALEGNPRPVVLTGDAGIGKTQLIRHFRRWTLEQETISVYGRFFDYRGARLAPYQVFIDLLRDAIGRNAEGESLRDVIEEATGVRLPAGLFGVERATSPGAVGDQYRFVIPICRCWLALSRKRPVVMILDDWQWADPASLDVVACLMRMLHSERLMLIMVVRANEAERDDDPVRRWLEEHAAGRAYTTLRLEPLDQNECLEVIGSIFGMRRSADIPRRDVESLYRLTNGNPYFLVETLRLLVAAGAVVPDEAKKRWIWKGIKNLALPETLVTAARAKVDRLSDRVRALLELASVLGDEFRVRTLCTLAGEDEESVEEMLSEGLRAGVLSIQGLTPGEDCRFQHSILRHVVYDSIPPHRRRALHVRAAEAIEIIYADERDRIAEALVAHYRAAGNARRSFEAGLSAWRTASLRSEWRKALALIERADEAARALEESEERLNDSERAELFIALAETWRAVGRIRDAQSIAERAVALATSSDDSRVLARAVFIQGLAEIAASDYANARTLLTEAIDLFRRVEDTPAMAQTMAQLAIVEAAVGNYERAWTLVTRLRGYSASEDVNAMAEGILGWAMALRGRFAEGAELLEDALEYYDRAGDVRERALLLRRLHWTHLSRGNYDEAIRLAIRAREDSVTTGDANGEAKANMGIGQARLAQGFHDEAMSFFRRAIEQLKVIGDAHCEAECLWLLGRAFYETGRLDDAQSQLDRSLQMIRTIGDRDDEFRILIDVARLNILRGELLHAQQNATTARRIAEDLGNREGSALAMLELAHVALLRGDADLANEQARRAAAVLEELQSAERWRATSLLDRIDRVSS
ncbi:MAG: tetratricopeptide repeat protein [Acidobacteria bacterium]|nr:tetratricopeptide repeat protein [Acidobacteriota bacterium]